MTEAAAVLEAARSAGVTLALGADDALRARPKAALTPALLTAIKAHRPALIALLRDPLAGFFDADLYRHASVYEFKAPAWGPGVFYLLAGPQAALRLEAEGVGAGRIYCTCLVLDWRIRGLSIEAQAEAARERLSSGARVPCVRELRA